MKCFAQLAYFHEIYKRYQLWPKKMLPSSRTSFSLPDNRTALFKVFTALLIRFAIPSTPHSADFLHLSKTTAYKPTCTSIIFHPLLGFNHIPVGIAILSLYLDTESTISPNTNGLPLTVTKHQPAERNSAASFNNVFFRARGQYSTQVCYKGFETVVSALVFTLCQHPTCLGFT
jgi:hypothetical protein